jgi:hypothetical protein
LQDDAGGGDPQLLQARQFALDPQPVAVGVGGQEIPVAVAAATGGEGARRFVDIRKMLTRLPWKA